MVDVRRAQDLSNDPIRTELGGGRVGISGPGARAGALGAVQRQRIPSLRQLASLIVNGVLTLPYNYRRGMFLDISV